MILGGYIVVRNDGRPFYGYGQTITVYPQRDRAAAVAAGFSTGMVAESFGPLRSAAVEMRFGEEQKEDGHVG